MNKTSIIDQLVFTSDTPAISVNVESDHSKEIRIAMRKGLPMKAHKAPSVNVVADFEGKIDFGVNDKTLKLKKGDSIALEVNVPHDPYCNQDATTRQSLSKTNSVERVNKIVN